MNSTLHKTIGRSVNRNPSCSLKQYCGRTRNPSRRLERMRWLAQCVPLIIILGFLGASQEMGSWKTFSGSYSADSIFIHSFRNAIAWDSTPRTRHLTLSAGCNPIICKKLTCMTTAKTRRDFIGPLRQSLFPAVLRATDKVWIPAGIFGGWWVALVGFTWPYEEANVSTSSPSKTNKNLITYICDHFLQHLCITTDLLPTPFNLKHNHHV